MHDVIRFSLPLTKQMQSFLQLRDGLICLQRAESECNVPAWLQAAVDLRASLLGEQGRKPAVAELLSLFSSLRAYLRPLAEKHHHFSAAITKACQDIDVHVASMEGGLDEAVHFLRQDAVINVYHNGLQKQDWLVHRPCMPQMIPVLGEADVERRRILATLLQPLISAVSGLDNMLHDFVDWAPRVAHGGSDQIAPERGIQYGLLVVGLERELVRQGIVPDIAGNRFSIQLRFQRWPAGASASVVNEDVPYSMMLVPCA
ncbi:MAG: hypothetical protein R8K46_05580 [Mariprofundaceae bacterium]